jgi:hypothetical protein
MSSQLLNGPRLHILHRQMRTERVTKNVNARLDVRSLFAKAQTTNPTCRSARAQPDDTMKIDIRAWDEQRRGVWRRKVSPQLKCDGIVVARCTVERSMWALEPTCAVRGRRLVITTRRDDGERVPDLVAQRNGDPIESTVGVGLL